MEYALGMIETRGLVSAVEAADTMTKTAEVHLLGYELATGGLTCVKIIGEVAAVKSAIEAAANRSAQVGELISVHVIPRPHSEVESIISDITPPLSSVKPVKKALSLDTLSVSELRKIARTMEGIGITGREISKANKQKLIREIKKIQ
jgi:microcompartment protein CcmL/EutN